MVSMSFPGDGQKSPIVTEENHGSHFTGGHSSLIPVVHHGYDDNGGVVL